MEDDEQLRMLDEALYWARKAVRGAEAELADMAQSDRSSNLCSKDWGAARERLKASKETEKEIGQRIAQRRRSLHRHTLH